MRTFALVLHLIGIAAGLTALLVEHAGKREDSKVRSQVAGIVQRD
jgi:hypothetical protein